MRFAAVGDIFPGDHYFSLGHGMMSRTQDASLAELFAGVAPLLQAADIAIANLECPLSHRSNRATPVARASFRGLPQFAGVLKSAGFTHINIANNHMLQHGEEAFADTLVCLQQAGLTPIGLSGRGEGCISKPQMLSIADQSVGIVGYSCVAVKGEQSPPYAYCASQTDIAHEIQWLSRQFDHLLVSCHAGDEGLPLPSAAQLEMYESFVRAGARAILGHHPHVLQPVVATREAVIAYSLGNFAFDSFWNRRFTTAAILSGEATPSALTTTLQPTRFSRDFRVRAVSGQPAADIVAELEHHERLMRTLDDKNYRSLLASSETVEQLRKYGYFFANLLRGNSVRKSDFLLSKLLGRPI